MVPQTDLLASMSSIVYVAQFVRRKRRDLKNSKNNVIIKAYPKFNFALTE